MVRAFLIRTERHCVVQIGIADNREIVAVGSKRLERGRDLKSSLLSQATNNASPARDSAARRAVHHFDRVKRALRSRGGLAQRRLRRHHRIQKRQRKRHAQAAKNRAPRKYFFVMNMISSADVRPRCGPGSALPPGFCPAWSLRPL